MAVYLSHDSKIVGTDTINGSEVFSYDVGGKPAHNLAPIGEGKFLSVHSGVVYLWSMDPKEDRQKPLMQWVHSSFADHSIPMGLIVMGPDLFVVTTSEVASVFNLVF